MFSTANGEIEKGGVQEIREKKAYELRRGSFFLAAGWSTWWGEASARKFCQDVWHPL